MEQIISVLEKIGKIAGSTTAYSAIEKDLMLQYTRELYETILTVEAGSVAVVQELTEEPEPLPEEVIKEETVAEETEAVMVAEEAEEAVTAAEAEELTIGQPEQQEPDLSLEEDREEEPYLQEEPDQQEHYSDITEHLEEEPVSQRISFELEPELQEEKPPVFQPRHSTDFRTWNRDIRSYIGINDKYNFISELFSRNSEAYEEILNEINQCENKQDALRFLENAGITTLYKWQQDGFSEQIFYNVLSQFFAAR